MQQVLMIFTRYPEPGRAKTRLIPLLGPAGAASLSRALTVHTLAWARQLSAGGRVGVQVYFEGADEPRMRACFGDDLPYYLQGTGDLGCRMARAFEAAFQRGAGRVILVGTDCPGITSARVEEAFDQLAAADLVLGPATDGGYYLIGLCAPQPSLFAGIAWGSETVLHDTLQRAEPLQLAVALLETLPDVDRPADLAQGIPEIGGLPFSLSDRPL